MLFTPSLDFVLLFVEDPQKSGPFYERLLGLTPVQNTPTFVMFMLPAPPSSACTCASCTCSCKQSPKTKGIALGLWSRHTAEPTVTATPGSTELCFPAADVDAVYAEWIQKGIPTAQAPTDMNFGRTCVALDPDGHRIRVHRLNEHLQNQPYRSPKGS